MIRSFHDKDTGNVYRGVPVRKFRHIAEAARKRLRWLDAAVTLQDLANIRSNHLEKLAGDRQGQYRIRVNDQYRVCFVWREEAAWETELTDDH